MSDEEIRNSGPFANLDEVVRQFANWSRGLPGTGHENARLLLREGLILAGVQPSPCELDYLDHADLDPIAVQITVAWLIRAVHPQAASSPPPER